MTAMIGTSRVKATLLILITSLIGVGAMAEEPNPQMVTIGTGGLTGIYYPLGGAVCRLVNREYREEGLRCLVDSTDGSVYNLRAVRNGELNIAVAQSDQQYNAHRGKGPFADSGPFKDLRALFAVHDEPFTIVARADSGIRKLDDLKGKRVNIGSPGSGQRATMEVLMRVKGWTQDDFSATTELGPMEQSQALCDNEVDAIVYTVGHPNRSILEATTLCDSIFVEVADPQMERFIRKNPHYTRTVIPGGMYRNNPEDTITFGVKATVVSSADMAETVAYRVVQAVFENFDEFRASLQTFSNLERKKMIQEGNSAPFHDGALRYYREAGLVDGKPNPRQDSDVVKDQTSPQ